MDPLTLLIAAAVGLATGLVPGLHVNTLAALALATVPLDHDAALALIVVGTVHTVVGILPATYLGAPGEDEALATLPAHQMLQAGRGPEAVRISVWASTLAMCFVVLALLPVKWILAAPFQGARLLEAALPWILGGVLALLLSQEPRGRRLVAAGILMLAGWLGWLAWHWPTRSPWALPGSPLLPLLTGLFALPTLRHAGTARIASQAAPPIRVPARSGQSVMLASSVAAGTAVLPGLTAAVATAIAHAGRRAEPRTILASLSAVNTAHHGFALAMLWIVGATRSGLADATRGVFQARPWNGAVPSDLHAVLTVALLATLLGAAGTLALERLARGWLPRVPARPLHVGALILIVATVAALTGPWGLALLAVATMVGELPLVAGTRRVHLAACLIGPVLISRFV